MRQFGLAAASILALAACDPEIPDSAAGVGLGDPEIRQQGAARDAQLADAAVSAIPEATGAPPASSSNLPAVTTADLAAAGIGAASAQPAIEPAAPVTRVPLAATAAGAAYVNGGDAGQTAVPERPVDTGPDIVAYALSTSHPLGQPLHQRTLPRPGRAERKCAGYRSGDLAQLAFLDAGGPERDRLGLDPDGDGYACNWDPGRYRRAVGG